LQRSDSERIREDAAIQESRQRQHSLSIAADAEERNRGRAHQIEWDEAYSNLGRHAPAMREGETSEAYRLRLASGVQACSADHRDLDLESVLFRQPAPFREAILTQIRADALKPEARITEIADGEIRGFKRRDESGREIEEFSLATEPHSSSKWPGHVRSSAECLAWIVLALATLAPLRSPATPAVCPFTTAYRAAPEILSVPPANEGINGAVLLLCRHQDR
jgi:hypothetical protein